MKTLMKTLIGAAPFLLTSVSANASETIEINATNIPALLDGRCGNDEWDVATKIDLPAQVSIFLMHDDEYFYICAKGKEEDLTVLDLNIEHPVTGALHNFHLSAQMSENLLDDGNWENKSGKWVLEDFAGFWVPFAGLKDGEERGPIWAKGTHRQVQVSRSKFPGNRWKMMFGISAVNYEGDPWAEINYPENGDDKDKSTWVDFSFSK